MINFIKSSETPDLLKLTTSIQMLLTEQRHQRADMATIKRQLHSIIVQLSLQKQVDEYFDSDETSPQTDSVEQ